MSARGWLSCCLRHRYRASWAARRWSIPARLAQLARHAPTLASYIPRCSPPGTRSESLTDRSDRQAGSFDGGNQLLARERLGELAGGGRDIRLGEANRGRHQDDAMPGDAQIVVALDLLAETEAVEQRHDDVEQHDVRLDGGAQAL